MKRTSWAVAYLIAGLLVSWQAALFSYWLAERLSWPFVPRWHGCWDAEHCAAPWWVYLAMALFVIGPSIAWTAIGLQQVSVPFRRRTMTLMAMVAATVLF
ncbi:hypothetical protein [Cupriavidus consociatus]|uniref:hypothetical protein n=1 Tax=Cupriavidus consociatus TaxID=2821357 RepID=UPI001AEB3868|nr:MULTISPECIES: hypothetical protein [unclassified Cupriavidus]MBP0621979.1 hypothetical protein [Cupriavidus sp. LEh25]MDK2658654.1 hypothetical protein [Cupriavidus sp. LEh21]